MLKSACRAYLPHLRCNICQHPLQVETRSEYSPLSGLPLRFGKRSRSVSCASCDAQARAANREAGLFVLQRRHDRVSDALKRLHWQAKPVDFGTLDYFRSCLLYATLVAADVGSGENAIPPLASQLGTLAPTPELSEGIYTRLYTDRLILPALSTDPNAFGINEQTGELTLDVQTGAWALANDTYGRPTDEVVSVLYQRLEQREPQAVENLWYLVAEDECKRYFLSQCERYRFIHPGIYSSKVATAIQDYLDVCSIGQMWNVIYYAVKNLAALAQEGTYTRQHIYNMIPGSIRRYADYRLAKDEPIHPWRRPSLASESWITSILLDKVLKGGSASFETLKGKDVFEHVERILAGPQNSANS